MTEEKTTKKKPPDQDDTRAQTQDAKDRRAEHLFASFFREEIASVETPPPPLPAPSLPAHGTSPEAAPAFLPDLLFAAAVLVMLTISLQNPDYSLRYPLTKAGIDFARDQRIGYHLEKSLAAFHGAAAPVFQRNNFRTRESHIKGAPK